MTKTSGANRYAPSVGQPSGDRKRTWILAAVVAGVVVVIGLVVLLWPDGEKKDTGAGTGADAARNASQETAMVTISGEDLPAMPDTGKLLPGAGEDDAVGLVAPKLDGQSFDESPVLIDPSDGKPKLVAFVAHWCPHCQAEVPKIQQWIDDGSVPDGLDVYAVSTAVNASRPNYPPSNWLASVGWTPPVMLDDDAQSAAQSWGLTGFPYFVMIDADGKVWQRGSGEVPIEDLNRLAGELVKGEAPSGGGAADDGLSSNFDAGATTAPSTVPAGG